MKRSVLFLLLVLSNGWLFANHWTPDDAEFEDNMTLTGVIQINGEEQQSANLEVGAFCGDECRGSVMPTFFPPTQRYLVQLTIFGVTGEQITFKIYDHDQNMELDLESPEAVVFNSDGYGSLPEPYPLNFTENVIVNDDHWIPNDADFEDNMTLTGVIQINGVEQQSTMLEVGVFCGEECRGSGRPTYFAPTQRYIIQLTIFGENDDLLTFKLYDHENEMELDLTSPEAVTFTANGYGSLPNPYILNFTTEVPSYTITVTSNPAEGGSIYGSGNYDQGATCTLTATANEGYTFVNWTKNGVEVSTEPTYTFTVTESAEYVANFIETHPQPSPQEVVISLYPGWNWFSYLLTVEVPLDEALVNLTPSEGDVIKGMASNSTYDASSHSWQGSLNSFVPGAGYMYLNTSTEVKSFTYPLIRQR